MEIISIKELLEILERMPPDYKLDREGLLHILDKREPPPQKIAVIGVDDRQARVGNL